MVNWLEIALGVALLVIGILLLWVLDLSKQVQRLVTEVYEREFRAMNRGIAVGMHFMGCRDLDLDRANGDLRIAQESTTTTEGE